MPKSKFTFKSFWGEAEQNLTPDLHLHNPTNPFVKPGKPLHGSVILRPFNLITPLPLPPLVFKVKTKGYVKNWKQKWNLHLQMYHFVLQSFCLLVSLEILHTPKCILCIYFPGPDSGRVRKFSSFLSLTLGPHFSDNK